MDFVELKEFARVYNVPMTYFEWTQNCGQATVDWVAVSRQLSSLVVARLDA